MTTDRPDQALATLGPNLSLVRQTFGNDEARLAVLKDVVARGCTDAELEVFALAVQRTKLDPFAAKPQIYAIKRRTQENGEWIERLTIQTSIDGFRLIAQRSREYQGQIGPQWCGPDGVWKDVWLSDEYPAAARLGILRKAFREPLWGTAVWSRARQMVGIWEGPRGNRRQTGAKLAPFWEKDPPGMLALAAERNAIRRAFPQDTYGLELATEEELEAEHDQTVANAARWTEMEREFTGPGEIVTRPNGNQVNAATGEVVAETERANDGPEEDPHVARRARLSVLLREARRLGLRGEPPPGHSSEDPLEVAIHYWEDRIENFELDQNSLRQLEREGAL